MPGNTSIYGLDATGHLIACTLSNGSTRWATSSVYLQNRLALSGDTLYGYQPGVGLVGVVDQGNTSVEKTLFVIPGLNETTVVSQPLRIGNRIHLVLGNTLLAVDADGGGKLFEARLNDEGPHTLAAYDNDVLVISGAGRPSRWDVASTRYSLIWDTGLAGITDLMERAVLVDGNHVFVGTPSGLTDYDALTGHHIWSRSGVGNLALAVSDQTLFAAGDRAAIWAIDRATGAVRWDRQYLAFAHTQAVGLALGESHLWVGAILEDGAESAALWAMNLADGAFAWHATGVSLTYGNGLPLVVNGLIYTYGTSESLTCMGSLAGNPGLLQNQITQKPNPLRGAMAGFNPVEITIKLDVPASISFICWHERDERNNPIGPISFMPGTHTINYNAQWPRGWTDINQFGRLAFDVQETISGLSYTQSILVPVNTLPDIHHHWAKQQIETMLYHKFINGYPDLTFQADNKITRAETSTIIARTLGLEKPSTGFKTKFTDIATHWARTYIMALEERNIIGGFLESDGTYTFRPSLDITRAQEARILVRAYEVPAAPAAFNSRFTDIAGHWAEPDVKALEAKGYVTGFREPDGTYTYRPEQNLTRAELSTMVVRIRKLTR